MKYNLALISYPIQFLLGISAMSNQGKMDCGRRRLVVATAAVGGVGAVAALVPFVSSMLPSERAKAAGAPVEVDISKLEPGQMMTVEWRGKPVWIINRTKEMLDTPAEARRPDGRSEVRQEHAARLTRKNETRSIKPEILVAVGICTHLGCSPSAKFKTGCRRRHGRRLAGRLPLPLPRFDLRLRRPRLQEQAGAGQPRGAAAHVSRPIRAF